MKIFVDNISVNYFEGKKKLNSIPILFLHGFTGSLVDWQDIIRRLPDTYFPFAIDLPGHGESDSPADIDLYTSAWNNKIINTLVHHLHIDSFALCGYSMGGRAALNYAINFPERVSKLILESSTPGIELEADRKARTISDNNLCKIIETKGINYFVDYWMNLEMFSDLKSLETNTYEKLIARKKNNSAVGLTNSLRGFGTGQMFPLWNMLGSIKIPTLLITGSLDKKFTQINHRMNKMISNSTHKIIKGSGHNVHIKNPNEFVDLLINFISEK